MHPPNCMCIFGSSFFQNSPECVTCFPASSPSVVGRRAPPRSQISVTKVPLKARSQGEGGSTSVSSLILTRRKIDTSEVDETQRLVQANQDGPQSRVQEMRTRVAYKHGGGNSGRGLANKSAAAAVPGNPLRPLRLPRYSSFHLVDYHFHSHILLADLVYNS